MAKARVVHSDDAVTVIFEGKLSRPEPSTAIVKFPGGHVEVARTSDGGYWAHVYADDEANIERSRIDYSREYASKNGIPEIADQEHVQHIAVKFQKGSNDD